MLSTEPVTEGTSSMRLNEVTVAALDRGMTLVDESEATEVPAALVATTVKV